MISKKIFYISTIFILLIGFLLRIFAIDRIPPSLYWEELALGYDAFSIKETLKDHHGNFLPIIAFESFGDYKPSLYFYLVVFCLFFLPLDILVVRLPSIMAGMLIIWGLSCLWQVITKKKYQWQNLIIMVLASLNPWLIHFSRGGWESNVASCLLLYGVIFFLKSWESEEERKFDWFLNISSLFFGFSLYTYHAARIIAPFLLMVLFSVYFIKQRKRKNFKFFCFLKKIFFPFFLNLFFFLPLFLNLGQKNVSNRFFETSIFSDIQIIEFSNDNRVLKNNSLFSRFFYHRYWLFGKEILENFVSHFNFNFLFVSGDTNARHSTQHFGLFYLTDIILFFVGLIYLVKIKNKRWELIIFFAFWLIIGILPSSISYGSPHALRILSVAPIFFLVLLLGVMFLFNQINSIKNIKFKIFLIATFGVFYFAGVVDFCNYYFNIYPKKYSQDWQYGYHDLMIFLNQYQDKISQIYVTREYGRPAMAYFFYNKINPLLVQQSTNKVKKDQSEILEFQNISFINSFNEVDFNKKNILVAGTISECRRLEELAINKTKKLLQEIKDLNQQVIWQVWQINY